MILINVSKRLLLLGKKRVYKHSLLNVCYPTFTNVRKKISNQTRLYYKRFLKKILLERLLHLWLFKLTSGELAKIPQKHNKLSIKIYELVPIAQLSAN